METYYEVEVKYIRVSEDGREKKQKDKYLFDAISYADAEHRAVAYIETMITGDFYITKITKSNIMEAISAAECVDFKYYKVKVSFEDCDDSGKPKWTSSYYLSPGYTITDAIERLNKSLSSYVVPYKIDTASETSILEVIGGLDATVTVSINTNVAIDEEQCTLVLTDGVRILDTTVIDSVEDATKLPGVEMIDKHKLRVCKKKRGMYMYVTQHGMRLMEFKERYEYET